MTNATVLVAACADSGAGSGQTERYLLSAVLVYLAGVLPKNVARSVPILSKIKKIRKRAHNVFR